MHDIRIIRENPVAFDAGLARRGLEPVADAILSLDKNARKYLADTEALRANQKNLSRAIGFYRINEDVAATQMLSFLDLEEQIKLMQSRGHIIFAAEKKSQNIRREISENNQRAEKQVEVIKQSLAAIPNLPAADVPDGLDEDANVELKRWGTPRTFDFAPQEHADFAPALGLDFETAAKMSGARFAFLRGQMARLERALGAFMLDMQTGTHGYTECATPIMVRDHAMQGTGQLPKFVDDQFFGADTKSREELFMQALPLDFDALVRNSEPKGATAVLKEALHNAPTKEHLWMIPTGEVTLTNSIREQILAETDLPMRLTALTPCFRSEAGSAGRDTRGYIRQHQFWKVELVSIVTPEASDAEHERMTLAAESVLEALELPYRRMLLCAGDMGFSARKTYDLDVWLPGQNAYREISSCSNCGDFQARRMDARYRPDGEKGTRFVHTLNGSGLAVGRTLVAVLENYQQADGSVTVPTALLPYMGGIERLVPN